MAITRTIKITTIQKPDNTANLTELKRYRISLGNGKVAVFENAKDAAMFLTEANRFLNGLCDQLLVNFERINTLLIQDFRTIRAPEMKAFLSDTAEIARRINLAIDRANLTNGNHFVFQHLHIAAAELESMAAKLEKTIRPEAALDRRLQAVAFACRLVRNQLDDFPDQRLVKYLNAKIRSTMTIKPMMK